MKYCPICERDYPTSERICAHDGATLALRDPYHLVGQTLAEKYRIDALIGLGGMGAVYRAYHLGIDRQVACKILQPNIAVGADGVVELFEREAKIAGRLEHENIVDIKDAGRTKSGIAYIIMEWLEGRTLADVLAAEGGIDLRRTNELLRQIAAALDCAHAAQIVHRDLKPGNIMLIDRGERGEQVKIVDFGIGKIFDETLGARVSNIMGTPHYASPEQLELGGWIDGRSDLYSLGVILFQMISGRLPFEAQSITQVIQLHLATAPPRLREICPDIPVEIDGLVAQLLAKDPELRPTSAGEVAIGFARSLKMLDGGDDGGDNNLEPRLSVRAKSATVASVRQTVAAKSPPLTFEQETAMMPTPVEPAGETAISGRSQVVWRRAGLAVLAFGLFGGFGYGLARWGASQSAPVQNLTQTLPVAMTPTPTPVADPSPTQTQALKPTAKPRPSRTVEPPPYPGYPRGPGDPIDPGPRPRPYPPPGTTRGGAEVGDWRGEPFRPRREAGRNQGPVAETPTPISPESRARIIANAHVARARVFFDQGDYQKALSACKEALQIDPGNTQAIALRLRIKKLLGVPEDR